MRLGIALALLAAVAACSGKGKNGTTAGGGSGGPALLVKKVSVSWGIDPGADAAEVFLVTTDETGKQVSHPLGTYQGKCTTIFPPAEMGAITGVACVMGGGGTELHAIARPDEIVVLKLGTAANVKPDPMARELVTVVKVPLGIAIEAQQ
ncbi:MAG: hypothetical protein KF773_38860 [Deltaproteobacteria bacterium]|nr:hypothetical protein [Deltaproteobacteria bacterium]MCW5804298.1 hypothetical protein [Deltaproteobacteria bacterium]